jgi:hypothetical protein
MVLKRLTPMAAKEKKRQQSRSIKLPGSVVERAWEGHGKFSLALIRHCIFRMHPLA